MKNKSVLFYGENLGLKNDFKRNILGYFKGKIIKRNQEEIIKNQDIFFEIYSMFLFLKKKNFLIDDVNDKFLNIFQKIEEKSMKKKYIYLVTFLIKLKQKLF